MAGTLHQRRFHLPRQLSSHRQRRRHGEAAGAAAAVAAKNKTAPHDVPWSEVRPVIEETRSMGDVAIGIGASEKRQP